MSGSWVDSLRARGVRSLDDLSHDQQAQLAFRVGVDVPEMHRAWAANGQLRRLQQRAAGSSPARLTSADRRALAARREREIADVRAGSFDSDLLREMLLDGHVWGEVTRAARALRVPVSNTMRASTYRDVVSGLDEIRRRWLAHDEAIGDDMSAWVTQTKRRITRAEAAYHEARGAQLQTLTGLERQARAVLGAARLGAA